MPSPAPALVATLGLRPQVITRALDHFLINGVEPEIEQVSIIHTAANIQHPRWPSLGHFEQYLKQAYPQTNVQFIPITDSDGEDSRIVFDVESFEYAERTYIILYNEIRRLKRAGHRLHGLLAGGRKSMIVYMMLSAQVLFDEDDHLWHLFSTRETQDPHVMSEMRDKMKMTGTTKDESRLVEIPILHLAGLMPMVREFILNSDDPTRAMRLYRKHETVEQIVRLYRFYYEVCDDIDRRILELAAARGLTNSEIARRVHLDSSTVSGRISKAATNFYGQGLSRKFRQKPSNFRIVFFEELQPLFSSEGNS